MKNTHSTGRSVTSIFVGDVLKDLLRNQSDDFVSSLTLTYPKFIAIAQKYQKMEEALEIITSGAGVDGNGLFIQPQETAQEALDFDPLKP